ncbi:DICT sensory domain-containing protein [Prochlorothrix hollandica]|uniref:DICT sensory domain-containing protein n=1 Tax=Prochlorothrix hollandica TaxID=1223 RepID=UPI0033425057
MPISTLEALIQELTTDSGRDPIYPQIFFKTSLTALSHAMEDQVLAGNDRPLVIASFQRERFYRQEAHRYRRIARQTSQVYILAAMEMDFTNGSDPDTAGGYETVAFDQQDCLSQEWNLIIVGQTYASCLICHERAQPQLWSKQAMDQSRQFEGIWTFDRRIASRAASLLLDQILGYRPELAAKVAAARQEFVPTSLEPLAGVGPEPFAERLLTYLQAGQYKLMKAYRSLESKEQRERLVNLITTALRQSLDPDEVFQVATRELGQALGTCRCLLYACRETDEQVFIRHECLGRSVTSLQGQPWTLQKNPLFQTLAQHQTSVEVVVEDNEQVAQSPLLQQLTQQWHISRWLLVPVLHQDQLIGVLELHHCGESREAWTVQERVLAEAIAAQVGVALIQARAFAHLEDLNQQLAALDRTRDNLTAIVGHELRTPLSTVQVCLESMATEPDMPEELRQVMIETAMTDAERLRRLVQDFLMLSRLESGRVEWNPEVLSFQECLDMALSHIRARQTREQLPEVVVELPLALPLVRVDGEWLVEVLSKILDNACKFTPADGRVSIQAGSGAEGLLHVTVADTGRGIEPDRLEAVFDRFHQEEGALRRTVGGTGLGLAIARQIIQRLGGQIWAESAGRDQGTCFHFTVPVALEGL